MTDYDLTDTNLEVAEKLKVEPWGVECEIDATDTVLSGETASFIFQIPFQQLLSVTKFSCLNLGVLSCDLTITLSHIHGDTAGTVPLFDAAGWKEIWTGTETIDTLKKKAFDADELSYIDHYAGKHTEWWKIDISADENITQDLYVHMVSNVLFVT